MAKGRNRPKAGNKKKKDSELAEKMTAHRNEHRAEKRAAKLARKKARRRGQIRLPE